MRGSERITIGSSAITSAKASTVSVVDSDPPGVAVAAAVAAGVGEAGSLVASAEGVAAAVNDGLSVAAGVGVAPPPWLHAVMSMTATQASVVRGSRIVITVPSFPPRSMAYDDYSPCMQEREYQLLERHAGLFNAGVWTGDWGPMLARFTDDAELVFRGVPVGPFRGRDAIGAAYRERPPDDEIRISKPRREGDELVMDYAWKATPGVRAGEMRFTVAPDGLISRLVVTFG